MMGQNPALMRSSPCSLWVAHLVFDDHSLSLSPSFSLTHSLTHTHTHTQHKTEVCLYDQVSSKVSFHWVTSAANRCHINNKMFWEELIPYFPWYSTGHVENDTSISSSIVACVFVTMATFLPNRCLAMIRGFLPSHCLPTIRGFCRAVA
jgi:hypothetical protein